MLTVYSAPGQCKETSYAYCCTVGTPCDCSQPPLDVDEEPTVAVPEESLPTDSEKPVQADDVTPIDGFEVDVLGNCKKVPYDFCCAVGTPCDCTKGTTYVSCFALGCRQSIYLIFMLSDGNTVRQDNAKKLRMRTAAPSEHLAIARNLHWKMLTNPSTSLLSKNRSQLL